MIGDVEVRELSADDMEESWTLGSVTFGSERTTPPEWVQQLRPGVTRYGAFDRSGKLVGKVTDLHHEQWWGGQRVQAADIGGVVVLPEARGSGIAHAMLRHLLEQARTRGAILSALYPTVAPVYRSAGWTMVGARRSLDLPTSLLSSGALSNGLTVRPGDPADMTLLDALYEEVAQSRNGLLSHTGPHFTREPNAFPDGVDGITIVEDDSGIVAGATWGREGGYQADGVLRVEDLVARNSNGIRALLGVLASWRPVAPTTRFRGVLSGPMSRELLLEVAQPYRTDWWMHRLIDVVPYVAARRWPDGLRVTVSFTLIDKLAPWNDGTWRLNIADGRSTLESTTDANASSLSIEGLGALFCGTASPALLIESGLAGIGMADDLALLAAHPNPELLDYF